MKAYRVRKAKSPYTSRYQPVQKQRTGKELTIAPKLCAGCELAQDCRSCPMNPQPRPNTNNQTN